MLSELPAEEEAVVNATGSLLKSLGPERLVQLAELIECKL